MEEENKPFNDAIDHFNKIEGNAANLAKTDLRKLPKLLKFFGYFMIGFFSISILLIILLNLFYS
ncbi:amino acid transporter [Neobacillus sp. 179-C4.2 HS]|uniref:Amino acid transporter n=1 Tax=Neobacillus driksii TaxID=3035913 RepID=A0ABV4YS16_9BACI|nr:amino acid transporter [Neobacillus sp. 179.-C4.2 HS]MDP5194224.1 amino acid transporter [Neobacillus sp. 179.-C4.2 HS]